MLYSVHTEPQATKGEDMTSTNRTTANVDRALAAAKSMTEATTDEELLAAAKAMESAACQLRRELKKVLGA